jgi:hypothetical protein
MGDVAKQAAVVRDGDGGSRPAASSWAGSDHPWPLFAAVVPFDVPLPIEHP